MSFLDELPKPFFILAPMDDVTDTVFRQIVTECAKPDLFFTEFVNVDGLQSPGRPRLLHKLALSPKEKPVIAQLWGLKPENFYKTAKEIADGTLFAEANAMLGKGEKRSEVYKQYTERASEPLTTQGVASDGGAAGSASRQASAIRNKHGFDGVDLNMGCPVKTVTKNGACAALINNRQLAKEIIMATREGAGNDFPVSVKTRVGFTTIDLSWIEFLLDLKILNMLSIHGRTAKQLSKVPANWELIGRARQMRDTLCPATLIVGNGDVQSRQQGEELAKKYQLDGIMAGRGIFNDPFLFAQKSPWPNYTKEQRLEVFRRQVQLFSKTYKPGQRRLETLRKFAKVYISDFDGASDLRDKFMHTHHLDQILNLLED